MKFSQFAQGRIEFLQAVAAEAELEGTASQTGKITKQRAREDNLLSMLALALQSLQLKLWCTEIHY